jgi:hypothetical protein
MGIIFLLFYWIVSWRWKRKKRSNSEINASPDGINDLNLLISVDSFRLN